MSTTPDDLGAFFKENARLVREYFEARMKIYRLKAIRIIARSAGNFLWIIISLFLFFLFFIFLGLVIGLWLSDVTGSYIAGFSITTGIMLLFIILVTLLRKVLFINPIIKAFISRSEENIEDEE